MGIDCRAHNSNAGYYWCGDFGGDCDGGDDDDGCGVDAAAAVVDSGGDGCSLDQPPGPSPTCFYWTRTKTLVAAPGGHCLPPAAGLWCGGTYWRLYRRPV